MMIVETMTRMRKITHRKTVRRKRMIVRNHRVLPRGRYGAGICNPLPGHGVAVLGSQSSVQRCRKYVLGGLWSQCIVTAAVKMRDYVRFQ